MHTHAHTLAQVRTISFNLKDPRNPDLRKRVVTGEVDPQVRVVAGLHALRGCSFGLPQGSQAGRQATQRCVCCRRRCTRCLCAHACAD